MLEVFVCLRSLGPTAVHVVGPTSNDFIMHYFLKVGVITSCSASKHTQIFKIYY